MSAGHYTSYVNTLGHWYCYDDSHPYEVGINDVNANLNNAYMLFYIRKYFRYSITVHKGFKRSSNKR